MATNVEVTTLKINKMSEDTLAEMKNAGTIQPNQLYVTDDDDSSAAGTANITFRRWR